MKRILSLILCIVVIANLVACSSNGNGTAVKTPIYPKGISFDDYDSRIANINKNAIDESYKKVLNKFSFNSASKILSGQSKNILYSPTSLYMTLSLAGIGAKGRTQNEIFSVLGERSGSYCIY